MMRRLEGSFRARHVPRVGFGAAPAGAPWEVSGGNVAETGPSGLAYAEPPEPPTTPGGKSLQRWSLSPARPSVWRGTKKWGVVFRANGRPVLRVGARPMRVASQSSTNLYPPPEGMTDRRGEELRLALLKFRRR